MKLPFMKLLLLYAAFASPAFAQTQQTRAQTLTTVYSTPEAGAEAGRNNTSAPREAPVLYAKSAITLYPASLNARLMPWEKPKGRGFDIEIRSASLAQADAGWFSFIALSDSNGVLIPYDPAAIITITPANQYNKMDIIMLDNTGTIVQILPNIALSDLPEPIASPEPVRAVLYLRGGITEKYGIAPGDRVAHEMFKVPPKVLTREAPKPAATAIITDESQNKEEQQ